MRASQELRSYVEALRQRLRWGAVLRGAAILTGAALAATLALTLIINRFAFSSGSLWSARAVLLATLALGATFGLALPLLRLDRRWSARRAERSFPEFQQRLLTFAERDEARDQPFLDLLAADTLRIARRADARAVVSDSLLIALSGCGIACLGVLIWLIRAGPGYLGYGAAALWTGPGAVPLYDLRVSPGDATVRRHGDQLVTAELRGIAIERVRIHARFGTSSWEHVAMQPQARAPGFQFLFAGIPEDVEYYVEAGPLSSRHFHIHVADVPEVKHIRVSYHFPEWLHAPDSSATDGGDLRAIEGTEARLEITTDRPVHNGVLLLDDAREVPLSGTGTSYRAVLKLQRDGTYHVATHDRSQPVRISEDYFIEAGEVTPPEVAIVRPGADYGASPIEEVTVGARATDEFGLTAFTLHYSVNGGPERTVDLLKESGAKQAQGATVISFESLKLVPGDVVSVYAAAKDERTEAHTDLAFIHAEPFEREFSQSQQAGGGGGAGAGNSQAEIVQREKEIIAATWTQKGARNAAPRQAAEQAKFLSDVQSTLRAQSLSLAGRLQLRDLTNANEQIGSFQKEMNDAAAAMGPAAEKLARQLWEGAVPNEQKALQHLLRAQATFRQIEVAFGSMGAGSGAVNSLGRDLESLADLELDTQKNSYETRQTGSTTADRNADIDTALKKLDELARRQSQLAAQHASPEQTAEERWQQEMLRRNAEELRRQIEQMARNNGAGAEGSADAAGAAQANGKRGSAGAAGAQGAQGNASVREALNRMREAEEQMRRAVDQHDANAARAAAERLREAMNLLGGMQQQQSLARLGELETQAGRLASEEQSQAERMRGMAGGGQFSPRSLGGPPRLDQNSDAASMVEDRQELADALARLEGDLRAAEREARGRGAGAASQLRDALSDLDQADTETRLQRSADLLRRGYNTANDSLESEIQTSLQHLKDQLGAARQALADEKSSAKDQLLDSMERLRSRLAALDPSQRGGDAAGQRRDGQGGLLAGPVDGGGRRGDTAGPVYGGWNTGNNRELPHAVAPDRTSLPADREQDYRQGMNELGRLRRAVGEDAEAKRQVDALIRAMQQLDPRRFPGNPAMVEELYGHVLSDVDKLELQLRHETDEPGAGDVRSDTPSAAPAGYQTAAAEYYRRLSKNP
ncbi:MAG TPA: hypothetical protein VMG11_00890 [Steroidobacteraceae bacterium]|nr:hypothetical protein [Steroidobacteraceae bacterium]